jgi:NAD(P)-dependent dehydrogenase (short-subunit alcohol dehydrogenase family)
VVICRVSQILATAMMKRYSTLVVKCLVLTTFISNSSAFSLTRLKTSFSRQKSVCSAVSNVSLQTDFEGKHVLVVGGSGRVGGSVVTQLIQRGSRVTVGGTRHESLEAAKARWMQTFPHLSNQLQQVDFVPLNREVASSIPRLTQVYDLVVHTAGPFQGKIKTPNGILEACVDNNIPYVDVCDDYCTAMAAKSKYAEKAKAVGVPCIVSTGCWPGVSSLMAKQLVDKALKAYPSLTADDLNVDFAFFTAGSGGAGATLLVATFLILAEEALTVVKGRRKSVKAMKDYTMVHFGSIVGNKEVAHLNLLETASVHEVLGVGSTKCLFGTAPGFWNTLLGIMAQLPPSLLANENLMTKLAVFSLPIVRVIDFFAGATNAMRCDVTSDKESSLRATAIYAHENLEPCVGECVVAFCSAILSGSVAPGVWFPEEAIVRSADAAAVLSLASVGAHTAEVDSTFNLSRDEIWGSLPSAATTIAT